MQEHAYEISQALAWVVGVLGTAFFCLIVWIVRSQIERVDKIGKSVEESAKENKSVTEQLQHEITRELSAIRALLGDEVKQMREMVHALDVRVVKIESHCLAYHGAPEFAPFVAIRKREDLEGTGG